MRLDAVFNSPVRRKYFVDGCRRDVVRIYQETLESDAIISFIAAPCSVYFRFFFFFFSRWIYTRKSKQIQHNVVIGHQPFHWKRRSTKEAIHLTSTCNPQRVIGTANKRSRSNNTWWMLHNWLVLVIYLIYNNRQDATVINVDVFSSNYNKFMYTSSTGNASCRDLPGPLTTHHLAGSCCWWCSSSSSSESVVRSSTSLSCCCRLCWCWCRWWGWLWSSIPARY